MSEHKICLSYKDAIIICELLARADFDEEDFRTAMGYTKAIFIEICENLMVEKEAFKSDVKKLVKESNVPKDLKNKGSEWIMKHNFKKEAREQGGKK